MLAVFRAASMADMTRSARLENILMCGCLGQMLLNNMFACLMWRSVDSDCCLHYCWAFK